jgi:L-asparaginase
VVFAGVAYRGNRVRKLDCERDAAFNSPNSAPLGKRFGHGWALNNLLSPQCTGIGAALVKSDAHIVRLTLAPGFSANWLAETLLTMPLDGVVLETYGSGNVPAYPALTATIGKLATSALVINCTQCVAGAVQMGLYASSKSLLDAGVIDGRDMTPEAAIAKLYWVCGQTDDVADRRRLFSQNRAGEFGAAD